MHRKGKVRAKKAGKAWRSTVRSDLARSGPAGFGMVWFGNLMKWCGAASIGVPWSGPQGFG